MKVALVVQRYGLEVCGGSELLCRRLAARLAAHWDLEVLTTCAVDHATWENAYPAGCTAVDGVQVRRFPVDRPRNPGAFDTIKAKVFGGSHGRDDEERWVEAQGPCSSGLLRHIRDHASDYDAFVFFTYLYAPTVFGLRLVHDRSTLVPTAHDEPEMRLDVYREVFRLPRALVFLTPEERDLVNHRFGTADTPQAITGVGVDVPDDTDPERFRATYAGALGRYDFILYAGRIERGKGCQTLFNHFMRFREDVPEHPAKLVLIGTRTMDIPTHPDIVHLGFVSDQEKFDAIAASRLVVQSSPYESLSIVALEAWSMAKPVLANGACRVLRGQCIRSNGGLWYESYPEFRQALALLLADTRLAERLGAAGRAFVDRFYTWEQIEAQYRALVERVATGSRSAVRTEAAADRP